MLTLPAQYRDRIAMHVFFLYATATLPSIKKSYRLEVLLETCEIPASAALRGLKTGIQSQVLLHAASEVPFAVWSLALLPLCSFCPVLAEGKIECCVKSGSEGGAGGLCP